MSALTHRTVTVSKKLSSNYCAPPYARCSRAQNADEKHPCFSLTTSLWFALAGGRAVQIGHPADLSP
ncbi:hypothetical protein, partial [Methylocaldum sp.]|uniref:hypothetical protein n=1 Tax=Methylocaldum sp. TaxID=1969727 RepID=UPI002D751C87